MHLIYYTGSEYSTMVIFLKLWLFGIIGLDLDNHFLDSVGNLLGKKELGFCFRKQPLFQMFHLLFSTTFLNGRQNQGALYLTDSINTGKILPSQPTQNY